MKKCTNCNRLLSLTEFHVAKDKKDGLNPKCKDCRKQYAHKRYLVRRDEEREISHNKYHEKYEWYLQYRQKNKKYKKQYDKIYYKKNLESTKNYNLFKTTEGAWTLDEKKVIFNIQNGKCANLYCQKVFDSVYEAHADHIHGTNKKRGLLCSNCNVSLGHAKDQIIYLEGLINYLKKYV